MSSGYGQAPRMPTTHVLVIRVPLHIEDRQPSIDAVRDAMRVALAVSRAAHVGDVCGPAEVEIEEVRE